MSDTTRGNQAGDRTGRKTTLIDVARAAGVSRTTASCILRGQDNSFAAVTTDRVLAAARELGFRPNAFARWLRTGKPKLLGLLTPVDMTGPQHMVKHRIEVGISLEAREHGMDIIKVLLDPDYESEADRVAEMLDSGILDCVILENPPAESPIVDMLKARQGSFVVIGNPSDPGIYSVDSDNIGLGRACAGHLISLGHSRIAYIAPEQKWAWGRDRAEGFREEARASGLGDNDVRILNVEHSVAGGDWGMRRLMSLDGPPTGIAACDDETAYGALWAAQDLGKAIPQDISLMGCNNDFSFAGHPGFLTTVEIGSVELGRMAARKAIAVSEGEQVEPRSFTEFSLVQRRSTAPPAA